MAKNKARHILHGVLDCLPIILIPIFMIYSQNHEINDNTLNLGGYEYSQIYETTNPYNNNDELVLDTGYIYKIYVNQDFYEAIGASGGFYVDYFKIFDINYDTYFEGFANDSISFFIEIYNRTMVISQDGDEPRINIYDGTYLYLVSSNWQAIITDLDDYSVLVYESDYSPIKYEYNENIVYNDTDIMSQSFYCLYNAVDKYFNMGNVFGMNNLYTWFETNIFGGTASPSIYIVWNIVLYEFIMDLLFLLYGLFMFFIDLCKRLMEKPLNSIK